MFSKYFKEIKPNFIGLLKKEYPDLKVTITDMISKGDVVDTAGFQNYATPVELYRSSKLADHPYQQLDSS